MCLHLACSQTLYFVFKVRLARVIKNKPRGIYWTPVQRGMGGGSCRLRTRLALALARVLASLSRTPMLQKNEKKNKTTSVYRLTLSTFTHTPGFYLGYLRGRSFPPQKKKQKTKKTKCPASPPPPPNKKQIFLSSHSISNYTAKKNSDATRSVHTP